MILNTALWSALALPACGSDETSKTREPSTGDDSSSDDDNEGDDDTDSTGDAGSTKKDAGNTGTPKTDAGKVDASAPLDAGMVATGKSDGGQSEGEPGDAGKDTDTGAAPSGKPPFNPSGAPLMAPENTWTYFEFADTKCRDGSPAGISVNMSTKSKNLMIYMEAGGACFESLTCLVSPPSVGSQTPLGDVGIFDRTNNDNPVKDWSYVYVPYCSGDVHLGSNDASIVDGVDGTQHFMGRVNLESFLNRVVPTFADAEKVLVTGASAGGFAASASSEVVNWAFAAKPKIYMLDDSGPPMSQDYLPKCLIDIWKKTWSLDKGIGADCGSDCTPDGDFEMEALAHILKVGTNMRFAVLESDADSIIRGFYGIGTDNGTNDCMGTLLVTPMDATVFKNGLLDLRKRVMGDDRFSSYYPESDQHTWIVSQDFYSAPAGGVRIVDWVANMLDDKPGMHVGP
ncbi:MAG TPA: pectin acetylesterase-family hydrolase [Polyangiaceae bacterium]|nr:pectin acetylesterase-family hydrolase [Polyangiaceae bacterium]